MAGAPDSSAVRIVEVAPRDGLQNHSRAFTTEAKIAFVDALSRSGLPAIEVTSFVNPRAVPLMADAVDVMTGIQRRPGIRYLALVPNEKGLERAIGCGVNSVAIFASASETFSQRNINCTIAESLVRFAPVLERARTERLWVRGYISMAFSCPFEGEIDPQGAARLAKSLLEMGCAEICLADTIGTATTDQVTGTLEAVLAVVPVDQMALHMHDTYGRAVDNIDIAYEAGIRVFDSAAGGLGGCPFAPGASGNLATERLVGHLDQRDIPHGVDRDAVRQATEALLATPAP
ncbi:MAG: hydroxymethylglutaryl-CoA lyase [Thermomicrobiales bacterium]|nr:hydroxymethylglutaryl-CoA lyase [Thermomicrobiales bacterium]